MTQSSGFISLLQITDMHVRSSPEDTLLGVNTAHYFKAVLELAFAGQQPFNAILVTGDLAQDPCPASYQYILETLEAYHIPCICLPGNHDDYQLMQQILNIGQVNCRKQTLLNNWQIICLNSQIPGAPGGYVSKSELLFLEACLKGHPERHALIAVHHHCITSKSPWMDTMMIENSEELLALVNQYPPVKAITFGHIHQALDTKAESIRLLGAPSTCFQFKPETEAFSLDDAAPGYRAIQLYPDGCIESDVIRLPESLTGLQTDTDGY
jgi:Icc protein